MRRLIWDLEMLGLKEGWSLQMGLIVFYFYFYDTSDILRGNPTQVQEYLLWPLLHLRHQVSYLKRSIGWKHISNLSCIYQQISIWPSEVNCSSATFNLLQNLSTFLSLCYYKIVTGNKLLRASWYQTTCLNFPTHPLIINWTSVPLKPSSSTDM